MTQSTNTEGDYFVILRVCSVPVGCLPDWIDVDKVCHMLDPIIMYKCALSHTLIMK